LSVTAIALDVVKQPTALVIIASYEPVCVTFKEEFVSDGEIGIPPLLQLIVSPKYRVV
jgi:hypothetical protein